nr:BPK_HP1_G0042910.mRNA.1.CDS.1 [Saccharomyces cerevisiae]
MILTDLLITTTLTFLWFNNNDSYGSNNDDSYGSNNDDSYGSNNNDSTALTTMIPTVLPTKRKKFLWFQQR